MPALPTGTVTLLFTDVEGSTKLVQALGDGWTPLLEEHRRLLRTAVAAGGGSEVDCRGDELFAAFPDADAAVGAAADAQRALCAWTDELRVRMGLHTGCPAVSGNGYVGLDVHRAARICGAGHGGQVLLSDTARTASGAEARDLGPHVLRGLPQPERLFQLIGAGLPDRFPPPNAEPVASGPRPRVVLADDSVLLREGIGRLLEDAGFEVAAQSGTLDDLLRDVAEHAPDVAVVDLRMPPTHTDEGIRAAREIRRLHPSVGVLLLSQHVEPAYARELLAIGERGVGYLLKDRVAAVDEFAAAVRSIAAGGLELDPELA